MNGVVCIIHIVERGDTIDKIAAIYGISPKRLIYDNGLSAQGYIAIGQALLILRPDTVYTVIAGDTLMKIAEKYSMTTNELYQNNPWLITQRFLTPGEKIAISFEGEGNTEIYINGYAYQYIDPPLFEKELPFLTDATLFGYGFTEDGELLPIPDSPLIRLSYSYNARPVLLLSSITEDGMFNGQRASILFNSPMLQNTVIEKLINVMELKGYLGIDIDFEFIDPQDSDSWISFLENITSRMHEKGFTVNVDLAPKTSATQSGLLYEAHNYERIGEIADTVLIMTYEWGYTFGPPMAVAPLPNVRKVVTYAVSVIDPKKILLGIPNYGYDWPLPFEKGVTRAKSIGNEEAISIAVKNGAEIQYDNFAEAPFFEYFNRFTRQKHVVWFEDIRSISAKYDLVDEFNLLGAGYWNLMRPFSQNWSFLGFKYKIDKKI